MYNAEKWLNIMHESVESKIPEIATGDVLQKMVLLKMLQNPRENTFVRLSFFIKLQG